LTHFLISSSGLKGLEWVPCNEDARKKVTRVGPPQRQARQGQLALLSTHLDTADGAKVKLSPPLYMSPSLAFFFKSGYSY
jgi:hypothetical protein